MRPLFHEPGVSIMRAASIVLFVTALFTPLSAAAEPSDTYDGRPLPEFVKRLLWAKACDVVERKPIDCAVEPCTFINAQGANFEPMTPPWMSLLDYEWSVYNSFQPALVESKLAAVDSFNSMRTGLAFVSGLAFDINPANTIIDINPALVRWVGRELIPPPETAMCGKTAQALYDASIRDAVRQALTVFSDLKRRGLLSRVDEEALSKAYVTKKGPFASACKAMEKGPEASKWPRVSLCWWWLRRAASNSVEPTAGLLRDVITAYDPAALKTYGKSLPKKSP
jgi:hypothetical protein